MRIRYSIVFVIVLVIAGFYFTYGDLKPGGSHYSNHYANWSKTEQYSPAHVYQPHSLEEVVAVVKKANTHRTKLYPIGSLHSWSFKATGTYDFISTKHLNKIIHFDPKTNILTVEAGARIEDVNNYLVHLDSPKMLLGTGSVQGQTIAGAMSNSLNPYGGAWDTFSSYVMEIQIVDGLGNVHVLTDKDGDVMKAARVSLGLLGVITRVKIKVSDLFMAVRSFEPITKQQALKTLMMHTGNTDHELFEVLYLVTSNSFTLINVKPVKDRQLEELSWFNRIKNSLMASLKINVANYIIDPLLNASDRFTVFYNKYLQDYLYKMVMDKEDIGSGHTIFINNADNFTMFEFYIPADRVDALVNELPDLYREFDLKYIATPVKFRSFAATHNTLLSPSTDYPTVSVLFYSHHMHNNKYLADELKLENYLIEKYNARTHWGEVSTIMQSTVWQKLYGNNFDTFVKIRRQFDPNNIFLRKPDREAFR